MSYSYPTNMKKLRACTGCKILKTESQWKDNEFECDNCGRISEESLTANHKGFVAFTDPKISWAAKWLSRNDIKPGLYCLYVEDLNEDEDDYEYDEDEVDE